MARALAADPPVLLMDEPFGAVDPIVRARLQHELLDLQAKVRKTIVLVTHDIDEAVALGDRVAVLNVGGVLEQYDTARRAAGRAGQRLRRLVPRRRAQHQAPGAQHRAASLDLDGGPWIDVTAGSRRGQGGAGPDGAASWLGLVARRALRRLGHGRRGRRGRRRSTTSSPCRRPPGSAPTAPCARRSR